VKVVFSFGVGLNK